MQGTVQMLELEELGLLWMRLVPPTNPIVANLEMLLCCPSLQQIQVICDPELYPRSKQ